MALLIYQYILGSFLGIPYMHITYMYIVHYVQTNFIKERYVWILCSNALAYVLGIMDILLESYHCKNANLDY